MKFPTPKLVSFRKEINEINRSTYLTHSLYYHPAKFIPQIVRFCLNNYCPKKGKILDPFAGSGTMGVEASINGFDSFMIDINPLLDYFYPIKIPIITKEKLEKCYNEAYNLIDNFFIKTPLKKIKFEEDLEYWYPEKLYNLFVNVWSNFNEIKNKIGNVTRGMLVLSLLKVSKKYSYAEHSMPKLFTSKRKKYFINEFIKDLNNLDAIITESKKNLRVIKWAMNNFLDYKKDNLGEIAFFSGEDSSEFDYFKLPKIDCIITSPPYLQAQEYIRTFKLEMMWLGFSREEIKGYLSKEIPFKENKDKISGAYIEEIRQKIKRDDLLRLYDSYFWYTINVLQKASERLKKGGKLCILIGNPKMAGVEVEIWKVIYEYFCYKLRFKYIEIYEDKILFRKLFSGRNNKNPEGMKSEYLLILEKN